MTDVSIVIVTWNSEDYIANCLHSLQENTANLSLEVGLVDNNSADQTVDIVRREFPDVHLIANPDNFGFARATNQGLKVARGRYLLLLNPDTIVQNGALSEMAGFMDENPRVGSLGPQLLNPDRTVQPSCREFLSYEVLIWEFTLLSRLFPRHPRFGRWRMGYFDHTRAREVDQPMGACLMVRREALEEVGLLDEDFFIFMNDQDLCYRLRKAGWVNYFYPEPKVIHRKGASSQRVKASLMSSQHTSIYSYLKKHHQSRLLPFFGFFLLVSAILRLLYYRFRL